MLTLDDGREVRYPTVSLHALAHAYAVSVHKAQGAEFPAVVIPLLASHAAMLGRTLLYTAVTRARGWWWSWGSRGRWRWRSRTGGG